ncbi:MAG: hypothetical protein RPU34_13100 [Candidatus Sedimenticola sp. (ex Thyasira tokunagai)]
MGIKKLLNKLNEYLDNANNNKKVKCDQIDEILRRLAEKEKSLKEKLSKEKNSSKKRRINIDLKIVKAQRKKGVAKRSELQKKCK